MQPITFRIVILLATFSVLGLVGSQVFWTLKAVELNTERFDRQVESSLLSVGRALLGNASLDDSRLQQPVIKVRPDYWVVMVNDVIDANVLEHLLRQALIQRQITSNFEYAIYDCESKQLRYGDMVQLSSLEHNDRVETVRWPKWDQSAHYFGVYFPNRDDAVLAGLQSWILSSVGVVFVVFFFSFTVLTLVRQRRLSQIQRDFINNLAHEFKTPISTISLSAQGLTNFSGSLSEERVTKYAGVIRSEAGRLTEQVEKILNVAKTDEGALQLDKTTFSLSQLISQVCGQFAIPDNKQPTTILFHLPEQDVCIEADKLHITNVLYNLLDNAVKYGDAHNEIELTLTSSKQSVQLTIRDMGVGIPASERNKVFKKFFRVNTGNVVQARGFGLGLYYVRTIIDAHQGRIEVCKESGWSTTIKIVFPTKTTFFTAVSYNLTRLFTFNLWK